MDAAVLEQYFNMQAKLREDLEATQKQMRENLRVQLQKIEDSVEAQLQFLMDQQDIDEREREEQLKGKNDYIAELEGKYNKKIESIKALESNFIDKEYAIDTIKREISMKTKENDSLKDRLKKIESENKEYTDRLKFSKKLEEDNKDMQEKVKNKEAEIEKAESKLNDYVKEGGIFSDLKGKLKEKDDLIKGKNEDLANIAADYGKYKVLVEETKTQKDAYYAELDAVSGKYDEIKGKIKDTKEENGRFESTINNNKNDELLRKIEEEEEEVERLEKEKETTMNKMPTKDQYQYRELVDSSSKDDTEKRWVIIPCLNWTNKTGNHSSTKRTLQRRLLLGYDNNNEPRYGDWETYEINESSSYTHRGGLW